MNKSDKFAIWSFGILLLYKLWSIITIIEYGKWDYFYFELMQQGWIIVYLNFLIQFFYFSLAVYLIFVYPVIIIMRGNKS